MTARRFAPLVLIVLVGCGGYTPEAGEEVQVSGKVAAPPGKSVAGFVLHFQPTGGKARMADFTLTADGTFSGTMTKGSYSYYLTPGKGAATEKALEGFPTEYRQGSLDRQIDVTGGEVQLKF